MRVAVIGTGYVGLVSGACLAELGHAVFCVDVDETKIANLKVGIMPIYEPGLEEIVVRNEKAGRLQFTTNFAEALPGAEVVIMAIGTPSAEDGSVDMTAFDCAIESVAKNITGPTVIADKSTVPVGTAERIERIARSLTDYPVDVISNPEFLREGHAVYDFLTPSRVVIGSASTRATDVMIHMYGYLDCPKFVMDRRSAELTKYAANAFLATKISFINEIAHLAEEVDADVTEVARGIGSDPRIGKEFLRAGLGWGGSCFPKDVRAIMHLADKHQHPLPIVRAAHAMNTRARERVVERIEKTLESLAGKKIAMLGIAFKGNTDDTRESASVDLLSLLRARGADVRAYDPIAKIADDAIVGGPVTIHTDPYEAVADADVVIVATDWEEFRGLDLARLREAMTGDLLVDARNLFRPDDAVRAGFRYLGVGR
jgi:UDPglucose 6-dehydrogenase